MKNCIALHYFLVSVFVFCGYGLYFWNLFQFCDFIIFFLVCFLLGILISVFGFCVSVFW